MTDLLRILPQPGKAYTFSSERPDGSMTVEQAGGGWIITTAAGAREYTDPREAAVAVGDAIQSLS